MGTRSGSTGTLIGETLGGYRVDALIGRGAMGTVYLAHDTKLNRPVALKVLLGSLARSPELVEEFHREAQAAAPLRHKGIVRMFEAGVAQGTPFIAMEYVNGEPLDRFLRRKGKIQWDVALHIGAKVADALQCAHEHGVIHRDIKPANILLDHEGGIRLTDFGIAAVQHGDDRSDTPSIVIGTPQYMAPEQLSGRDVGPASDLFSLGVTLHQMISNRMPFTGEDSVALVKKICNDDPVRLNKLDASVPDDAARLVAYLLEKKPEARPASAKVAAGIMRRIQRKGGGDSVLSESLNAFIQEGLEDRPFRHLRENPEDKRKPRTKTQPPQRKGNSRSFRVLGRVALAIALILAAGITGPILSSTNPELLPEPAVELPGVRFESPTGIDARIRLPISGFRISELSWIDNGVLLLQCLRAAPKPGTYDTGWLAVDLNAKRVVNIQAPPALASGSGWGALEYSFRPAPGKANAPGGLSERLLLAGRIRGRDEAVLLAQDWKENIPGPRILLEIPEGRWPENGVLAVRPDGNGFGLLAYDASLRGVGIVEHDLTSDPAILSENIQTGAGGPIVPESVSYTPTGRWISYVRETATHSYEWWLLPSGLDAGAARRVYSELTRPWVSIQPMEDLAVLTRLGRNGAETLDLVDAQTGRTKASLGPGVVGLNAWHSSGEAFVFALESEPESDASQWELWATFLKDPNRPVRIHSLGNRLSGLYGFSPDGQWLVATTTDEPPQVMAIRWDSWRENRLD